MFSRCVIVVLFCLGASSVSQADAKLADFVTSCSLKDPNLDDCLLTQGRALLPHLVTGVREWGILPLDPLVIPRAQLQEGGENAVGLSLVITNSKHAGWKDMIIKEIKLNKKTFEINVVFFFPNYVLTGEYEAKGRILLLPVTGNGKANITFINSLNDMVIKTRMEERGGKTYLTVSDVKNLVNPQNVFYRFDNLFNNKQLGDTMNTFLNENALEVYNELRVNIQHTFDDILLSLLSRMFNKIPLNQLFTDAA